MTNVYTGNNQMNTVSILTQTHYLNDKWDLYYHLPQNSNWDLSSYTIIQKSINTAETVKLLSEHIHSNIVKHCMLFAMRTGITPMWEDARNRNGGYFSYKVSNKHVYEVWKHLFTMVCGETLCVNPNHNKHINGITLSPKKQFCIVKIWLDGIDIQDPNSIVSIPNLLKQGCLFKKQAPEY
jgi:hypothetical protein